MYFKVLNVKLLRSIKSKETSSAFNDFNGFDGFNGFFTFATDCASRAIVRDTGESTFREPFGAIGSVF